MRINISFGVLNSKFKAKNRQNFLEAVVASIRLEGMRKTSKNPQASSFLR
jgi:hypothetical protein